MIQRPDLASLFASARPLVGMIHLEPLPGAPRFAGSMSAIIDAARRDAAALMDARADGIIIENFGDVPFHATRVPPETVAAIAICVAAVAREIDVPFGVNVLRNDAAAALAIAAATGAAMIRVNVHTGSMLTDQGWIDGHAADTLRRRAALRADVAILADVFVKHATPPAGLRIEDAARDTWQRGLADALIVSGSGTGEPVAPHRITQLRDAAPDAPIWIGSGITAANAASLLPLADGAIIGSAIQHGGRAGARVDAALARRVFAAARDF